MKVFVVEELLGQDVSWLIGVFSSKERAEAVVSLRRSKLDISFYWKIIELDLDKINPLEDL